MTTCHSCGANVRFVRTLQRTRIAIDVEPHTEGIVNLVQRDDGHTAPRAQVLSQKAATRLRVSEPGVELYRRHVCEAKRRAHKADWHVCPVETCETEIPVTLFVCNRHWYVLTKPMRAEIWATLDASGSDFHEARTRAIEYLDGIEARFAKGPRS